jgi:predicted nucleotidyltransferase
MILTQKNIKQFLQEYFKNKPVKKAYLFGSFARGAERKDSDIDIIVELDYSKKIGLDFIRWNYELEKIFGRKTDLVPEDSMYQSIKQAADKYKILMFEN